MASEKGLCSRYKQAQHKSQLALAWLISDSMASARRIWLHLLHSSIWTHPTVSSTRSRSITSPWGWEDDYRCVFVFFLNADDKWTALAERSLGGHRAETSRERCVCPESSSPAEEKQASITAETLLASWPLTNSMSIAHAFQRAANSLHKTYMDVERNTG